MRVRNSELHNSNLFWYPASYTTKNTLLFHATEANEYHARVFLLYHELQSWLRWVRFALNTVMYVTRHSRTYVRYDQRLSPKHSIFQHIGRLDISISNRQASCSD